MATNPSRIRKTEKVGDCPACGNAIEATAHIVVEMLEPVIETDGETKVETKSTLEYYHVSHRCPGNAELTQDATVEPEEPEVPEVDDEDSDAAGSED